MGTLGCGEGSVVGIIMQDQSVGLIHWRDSMLDHMNGVGTSHFHFVTSAASLETILGFCGSRYRCIPFYEEESMVVDPTYRYLSRILLRLSHHVWEVEILRPERYQA